MPNFLLERTVIYRIEISAVDEENAFEIRSGLESMGLGFGNGEIVSDKITCTNVDDGKLE